MIVNSELPHRFLAPLEGRFSLKSEGLQCEEPIAIEDLDFVAGDVVGRQVDRTLGVGAAGGGMYGRFSQYHAEQLLERKDELPRFEDGTKVIFPGTVFVPVTGPEIEFYSCLTWRNGMPEMGVLVRFAIFGSDCRFPYLLHSRR